MRRGGGRLLGQRHLAAVLINAPARETVPTETPLCLDHSVAGLKRAHDAVVLLRLLEASSGTDVLLTVNPIFHFDLRPVKFGVITRVLMVELEKGPVRLFTERFECQWAETVPFFDNAPVRFDWWLFQHIDDLELMLF